MTKCLFYFNYNDSINENILLSARMYRSDKIHPLDIQDLENNLFYQKDKEEENIKIASSCLSQIWNTIFASTIHQSLEEAKENYDELCSKREAEIGSWEEKFSGFSSVQLAVRF